MSRRAVLYGLEADGLFGCRSCMRLAYTSEAENVSDRLLRKQRKLEGRLTSNRGKPRWMRWRTHERISSEISHIERRWGAIAVLRFPSLRSLRQVK